MKNMIKKVLSFVMVLTLIVMAMPAMEVKAYDPKTDTGVITINKVTVGNKLKGYKVIDITYNTNNTVSYEWASPEIAEKIKEKNGGTELSVKDFAEITDPEERQRLLSGLPALLEGNGAAIALAETEATSADSNATEASVEWSGVGLGGYLIMPTSSTDVYQIMLAIIQPELNDDGDYVTSDETIDAKKAPVDIDKKADDDTTGDAKVITYTIMADVPVYGAEATDVTYIIGDKLSAGLSYVEGSLKVYGYEETRGTITDSTSPAHTLGDTADALTTPNSTYNGIYTGQLKGSINVGGNAVEQTFTLTFNYTGSGDKDNLDALNIQTIKITYQAKVNENATVGSAGNKNDATMEYSHYPYIGDNHETATDDATVYTFQIDVDKVAANSDKKLEGAKFDVYYKVETSDTTVDTKKYPSSSYVTSANVTVLPAGSNYIKVGEITTNADGKASIDNLDAGTYYLVETAAPNGYTLPTTPFTVTLAKDSTDDEFDATSYIYTKKIENSMGFTLPETGGTGTVIFTVVGVSLMCVAVLAFFILRKKEVSKN